MREQLTDSIAAIDDEFRLLAEELAGTPAWRAPLNVYVINAWGAQYSWREESLIHLTDMPVQVRFLSLLDIERDGIPADAHVLLNYGPGPIPRGAAGTSGSRSEWRRRSEILSPGAEG